MPKASNWSSLYLTLPGNVHRAALTAAEAEGRSLSKWVESAVMAKLMAHLPGIDQPEPSKFDQTNDNFGDNPR